MPTKLICCVSLPDTTISSVPIYDFAKANEALKDEDIAQFYVCCGKYVCRGCIHSFVQSGNDEKCPFCNSDWSNKTQEERVEENMKRVEANDPTSIWMLAGSHYKGLNGIQQDRTRAIELYARSAELGFNKAHNELGDIYEGAGNLKKAKFHYEAAAMAGNEEARNDLGVMEAQSRNMERAAKHWTIAASAGHYMAMHHVRLCFEKGHVSRESIDSTLAAYNASCAEMRSEARDAYIRIHL
jgi:rubrerythrin